MKMFRTSLVFVVFTLFGISSAWRCDGDYEEFIDGCKPCMQTCADRRYHKWCPDTCRWTMGCYCMYGYLRNQWGRCVPSDMCLPLKRRRRSADHQTINKFHSCGHNEVLRNCKPCLRTCEDVKEAKITGEVCSNMACSMITQCICRPGFVRHHRGECIRIENCK